MKNAPKNLDDATADLPAWDFSVTIGGKVYPIRQPSLAEEQQLSALENLKDSAILELFWGLFRGPRPAASTVARDVLLVFFVELLFYRHQRTQGLIGHAALRARQKNAAEMAATKLLAAGLNN